MTRAEAELSKIQAELKSQPRMIVLEKALADEPFLHAVVAQGSGRTAREVAPLTFRSQEQNPVFNVLDERRALIAKDVEALRAELGSVEERMAHIRAELAGVRSELAAQLLEQTRLNRRADVARRAYEALLLRREEARIAARAKTGSVELLAAPVSLDKPVSPRPGLNAAVAATVGFLVAVFGVILRDAWAAQQVGEESAWALEEAP